MMNICQSHLVFSLMALSSLCSLGAESLFLNQEKAIENCDLRAYLGEDLSQALPEAYKESKFRYQELGSLTLPKKAIRQSDAESDMDIAASLYLQRVRESSGEFFSPRGMGVCSPFITDKKSLEIAGELGYLARLLYSHDEIKIIKSKQEGTLGVSLFLSNSRSDPFRIEGGFVALIKKGETWEPCVTPGSFANTNISYEGGLRLSAEGLEQWAQSEVSTLKNQAMTQVSAQAVAQLEDQRAGLAKADATMLLSKLAQGMASRNALEIAAVLNVQDGVKGVVNELEHTRAENSGSFIDRLSGPRCVIVPLDPKPIEQTKEEEELRQKELLNNGMDRELEKNGEKGQDCALGIIAIKPALRYSARPTISYYLPLHYRPAGDHKQARERSVAFTPNLSDKRPFLALEQTLIDNSLRVQDWELGGMSCLMTVKRMARDFHRTYPAFQFKTLEEAITVIFPALQEERFTDLLRCLPPRTFTSGSSLMEHINELVKLSELAGALPSDHQNARDARTAKRFNPAKKVSQFPIKNVVLYEQPDEALVFWQLSANSWMQINFAHMVLKKEGDVWYLSLSSDSVPPREESLGKIASQLKSAYNANLAAKVYDNVAVLKKPTPVESAYIGVTSANKILDLGKKNQLAELVKHCLILEDTPEAHKRLKESVMEYLLSNKTAMPGNSCCTFCGDQLWCVVAGLQLREGADGSILRDAPMLLFVQQEGKLYWVPELTLFSPVTPVRMMLSNKRLNMAKKFLSPALYNSYQNAYRQHCKHVEQDSKRRK